MLKTHISSSVSLTTFTPVETITNLMCSFFIAFLLGCLYNSIAIDLNSDFFSYCRWSLFYLLMLQSTTSADFQQSVCVEFHFKQAVVCNTTTFTKQILSQMFSSFLKNFLKYVQTEQACVLSNLFSRKQPATLDILQNKLITVQRQIQEFCRIEEISPCERSK